MQPHLFYACLSNATCLIRPHSFSTAILAGLTKTDYAQSTYIVAIFYPFSQFCEIDISLLSLQTQPKTAPNLFKRGVEYGKYDLLRVSLLRVLESNFPGDPL